MVGTAQPVCLSASGTEPRRYESTMNLRKGKHTASRSIAGAFIERDFRNVAPELDFQNFRCRSPQNHLALLGIQVKLLDNFHRTVITNGEAVVAAHHDSIDAHLGDDELHHRL